MNEDDIKHKKKKKKKVKKSNKASANEIKGEMD
jgi:hypothetical protein